MISNSLDSALFSVFNALTPGSEQHVNSPHNFIEISVRQVLRIKIKNYQGPVAGSLVSANRWLRGVKTFWFPWYLTPVSANHASSNPGQLERCDLDITPNSHGYPTKKSMVLVRRMNVSIVEMIRLSTMFHAPLSSPYQCCQILCSKTTYRR